MHHFNLNAICPTGFRHGLHAHLLRRLPIVRLNGARMLHPPPTLGHLSYYMVGFYIDLLRISLLMDRSKTNPNQPNQLFDNQGSVGLVTVAMLKKSRYIFHLIYKALMELNEIFSLPALVAISTRLVTIVSSLFFVTYRIIHPNPLLESTYSLFAATFFIDWIAIFVFFTAADMSIKKVKGHKVYIQR